MVRAAVTNAIDYSRADPYSKKWRIKHILVLREVARQTNIRLLESLHEHWQAYVSHSRLNEDSWTKAKEQAANTLAELQDELLPWTAQAENEEKPDTIEGKYGDLIAKYRALVAQTEANKAIENGTN